MVWNDFTILVVCVTAGVIVSIIAESIVKCVKSKKSNEKSKTKL